MRGKFVVIEGGDGSGKGMCINALKEIFTDRKDVVFTREPGGTRISEIIRDILMNKENKEITPLAEILLFSAARAQHVEELILPALQSGKHVICDRFYFSTVAYQIYGREREALIGDFRKINNTVIHRCCPDHVVYLEVTPEVGLRRKEGSEDGKCTRFDNEKLAFHRKVYEGFRLQLSTGQSDRVVGPPKWHIIETEEMPAEEVKTEFLRIIRDILEIQN